jgi:hypothetical protein
MKRLLSLVITGVLAFNLSICAEQLPKVPPADWAISIRLYGTTDLSNHNSHQISIYTNGISPASLSAIRPSYDDKGYLSNKSLRYETKIGKEAALAIYNATRTLIYSHQVGVQPSISVRDGDSVEVSISSFDRKISIVFDHSGFRNSREFEAFIKPVNAQLPENFRVR